MKLSVSLCLCGILLFVLSSTAAVTEEAYRRVADRLMCQCGCGQSVGGCNHYGCTVAATLRKEVREALASTPNEERAVELVVQKWGVKLLAEPPRTGFNLAAWVMPFVVLTGGAFFVSLVLRQWRRKTLAAAQGLDPALLARYETRIDEEIDKG